MTDQQEPNPDTNDPDYLRDLADRLWQVPPAYGVDQGDVERLRTIADGHHRNVDAGSLTDCAAFFAYVRALIDLHEHDANGTDDSPEADAVRDAADEPWRDLTPEQRNIAGEISELVYRARGDESGGPWCVGDIVIGVGDGPFYLAAYEVVTVAPYELAVRLADRIDSAQPWIAVVAACGPGFPFGAPGEVKNHLKWRRATPEEVAEIPRPRTT